MIVDSSALLALLFDEPEHAFVATALSSNPGDLLMSTVNLTEMLIVIRDRRRADAPELESRLSAMGLRFVAPDPRQADLAASARLRFPLNLGDCFAYALAVTEGKPLLAVDADFRRLDIPVILPPRLAR